ncbi:MAG: hypothetical protein IT431_12275 [Phycisphaerales bacterium]|nr:hypothetical protein [Phycisphaerales bacterium]
MTLLDDYRRVTKACPCPICERPDWCLVSRDDPPSRVICSRTESKQRWGEAGWLHVLRKDGQRPVRVRKLHLSPQGPHTDLRRLAEDCRGRLRPGHLNRFAEQLGVTTDSLWRLGIGWDGRNWTFPMSNADGVVLGIRLRTPSGRKFSVKGGKHGLHIPTGLSGTGPLLLPEGPTDTAAALDLGFDSVGRPGCRGAMRLIAEYIRKQNPTVAVVVADADAAGRGGAMDHAGTLACYHRDVRVIEPPVKDLREWLRGGATAAQVNDAIERAAPSRLCVRCRGATA